MLEPLRHQPCADVQLAIAEHAGKAIGSGNVVGVLEHAADKRLGERLAEHDQVFRVARRHVPGWGGRLGLGCAGSKLPLGQGPKLAERVGHAVAAEAKAFFDVQGQVHPFQAVESKPL